MGTTYYLLAQVGLDIIEKIGPLPATVLSRYKDPFKRRGGVPWLYREVQYEELRLMIGLQRRI